MEQGATTIASTGKDPLASGAEISSTGQEKFARDFKSAAFLPVSRKRVFSPERLRITWISTPGRHNLCKSLSG
jgi:hypothetical protein